MTFFRSSALRKRPAATTTVFLFIGFVTTPSAFAFSGRAAPPALSQSSRHSELNVWFSRGGGGSSGVAGGISSVSKKLSMVAKPSQVLVAGANGGVGQRIVRELLSQGVKVTAAVTPSGVQQANQLFSDASFISPDLAGNLNVVGVDPAEVDELCRAMQTSQAVVCAQGNREGSKGSSGLMKGPSEVDGKLSALVVQAAKETGSVKHFVLVTARPSGGKFGIPASAMKLLSGGLAEEKKAEKSLVDSGLAYTIVRPGEMEGVGDDLENTHNVRVVPNDTSTGGVVSRLQVAKVCAAAVVAPDTSTNKIMDIVAEDLAPRISYDELVLSAKDESSEEAWKNSLNPAQYYVLRMAGTEPSFSSPLNGEKRTGQYLCAGCGQPLFSSDTKYNSGTGWPSFWQPVEERSVRVIREGGLFPRREVRCSNCDGHLGHVFADGPRPTGMRYCMNGVALGFEPKKDEE